LDIKLPGDGSPELLLLANDPSGALRCTATIGRESEGRQALLHLRFAQIRVDLLV
jgi:hypothetical protein